MRRIQLVGRVIAVALALVMGGCATTSGSGSGVGEAVDYRSRAEGLPFGEATVAVASVHPERFDELVERNREALGEWVSVEGAAPAEHGTSRMVAALFQSVERVPAAVDQTKTEFRFETLDRSRAVYVGLTARGHRERLEAMEVAQPREDDGAFGGYLARLAVPAEAPAELVEEFEAHCDEGADEWMGGDCGAVVRFAAVGGYAVADLYYGADASERREAIAAALPEEPGAPGGYFERLTPAARAFVGPRAAGGVYARTEDLWKIAVLHKMAASGRKEERIEAGTRAAGIRKATQRREAPYAQMARQAELSAPEVREYEDIAVVHGVDGGHFVDAVRSYTERGRRIAKAGRLDTRLPRLAMGDATLEVEWAYDALAALRLGADPAALSQKDRRFEGSRPFRALQTFEPLVQWTPMIGYPISTARFLGTRSYGWKTGRIDALKRLWGVRALRAELDVAPSEEAPLGVEISGAAVAEVSRESNLDATVETAVAIGRRAGLPVRMEADYQGEFMQLKVTMNASMSVFEEPERVGGGRIAHLDLGKLAAQFDYEEVPSEVDQLEVPEEPGTARHLEVAHASNAAGRGFRLRLGAEEREQFSIPAADVPLASPSAPPPCARRAVAAARELLSEGQGSGLDFAVYTDTLPKLVGATEACQGKEAWAERLRSVAAANLVIVGDAKARTGEWTGAERNFRRACEFGAEEACERAERAAQRAGRLQLPSVGTTFSLRGALPEAILELNREGLRADGESLVSLEQLGAESEEGTSVTAAIESHAGPTPMKMIHGFAVATPVAAETSLAVRHVEELARQAFETSMNRSSSDRRKRRRGRRNRKTEAVLFFVKDDGSGGLERSGPNYLAISRDKRAGASSGDASIGLSVEVSDGGFEVRTSEGRVDPVEGCGDQGATVCPEVDAETMAERMEAYRSAEGDEAAREAAARVAEAYPYHRLYRVLVGLHEKHVDESEQRVPVRLAVDDELPFAVLAKTMATVVLRGWNVERYESASALFGDMGRRRAMFDVIYLDLER